MPIGSTLRELKEEEIVHQIHEDVDKEIHESHPCQVGQDEAYNDNVFH
jgi:hypothetical protein